MLKTQTLLKTIIVFNLIAYIGCVGQGGEKYQRPIAQFDKEKGEVVSWADNLAKKFSDGTPIVAMRIYQDSSGAYLLGRYGQLDANALGYAVFDEVEIDEEGTATLRDPDQLAICGGDDTKPTCVKKQKCGGGQDISTWCDLEWSIIWREYYCACKGKSSDEGCELKMPDEEETLWDGDGGYGGGMSEDPVY